MAKNSKCHGKKIKWSQKRTTDPFKKLNESEKKQNGRITF
jgi:hypothetical protein